MATSVKKLDPDKVIADFENGNRHGSPATMCLLEEIKRLKKLKTPKAPRVIYQRYKWHGYK